MKKYLLIALSFLLIITGCNKVDNEEKQDALNAYVNNYNKLVSEDNISVDMQGVIKIPKSAINKEEFDSKFSSNILIDLNNALFQGKINVIPDEQKNEKDNSLPFFFKDDYFYFQADKQWLKMKDEYDVKNNLKQKDLKINIEKAEENLKDAQYRKSKVNGVQGYEIRSEITLDKIMKSVGKIENKEQEEALGLLKGLKVNTNIFVPQEVTGNLIVNLNLKVDSAFVRFSIDNFNIDLKPTNEKIKIDSKIEKKAISINNQ